MKNKSESKQKGITLVALVITIVILLILAGISISALTNTGLFEKAKEAKQETENAQAEENAILENYLAQIDEITGGTSGSGSSTTPTITDVQSDDMLTKTENTTVEDTYGNKITIPAGFKVTADATTVDKGIVIEDTVGNQFVWIPVGKVYTDEEKTEENAKTIELGRYIFNSDGTIDTTLSQTEPDGRLKTSSSSSYYYTEGKASDTTSNIHAKDIDAFKTSATTNGGYYIGRYEARKSSSGTITEIGTDNVYNSITQPNAATIARNMYPSNKFTSDLINSYAWDTATLFLQECGDNPTYSRQTSLNTSLLTTGTNNSDTKDVQCNVYDMASNTYEWTTETYSNSSLPCVRRGGNYDYSDAHTSLHVGNSTSYSDTHISFRPLLYL